MFSFNYKLVPVNLDKDIYKLTPTAGTILKAFAPSLILSAAYLVMLGVAIKADTRAAKDNENHPYQD